MRIESALTDRIASIDPASAALSSGSRTLTYGELNQAAGRYDQHLRSLGVTHGSSVAICVERSFAQIAAALGAFRAGACYVPIDPEWPEERIQHVLEDSDARVLIAPPSVTTRLDTAALPLDPASLTLLNPGPASAPPAPIAPTDLAYIIYTSGSTGVPKGVEITHRNLEHLVAWHQQAFQITASDRATYLAGLGFDAAVWEIWPYLSTGAHISLADPLTRTDPSLLQHWLVQQRITVSFVPTPLAEPLAAIAWPAETRLRFLLTGGDTLHTVPRPDLPFALINNYGPTECTVVATSGPVPTDCAGLPTIGKAIHGTSIYLLDEARRPVPEGTLGEIYIGGRGVGAGYRKLPQQTAATFLPDPFLAGGKMFKTGDMAVRLPDTQLSFRGRRDSQEKIRGHRIELDEIVCVLNRHPSIACSAAAVRTGRMEDKTDKMLVAYVVPADGASLHLRDLQQFASRSLPDYMIPSSFVRLEALPLSLNGKVDVRSLPEPTPANLLEEPASRAAQTEVEQILLDTVRRILHTESIGVEDDFFLAGGHSLLGTQVVLRARETFGVMLSLRDLFENPTVADLATRIEELLIEELEGLSEDEALQLAAAGQLLDAEQNL